MKTGRTLLAFSLLSAGLFSLAGCGYKDNPVPPQQVVPTPITDLRYQLNDKGVTLSWSYPSKTVTGHSLSEISSFDVYRAVLPAEEYCETCPIPFSKPVKIPGGAVPDKGTKTAVYESALLRPGNMYFFKVRATAGWWATSADSNVVSFLWNIPARAPENLQALGEDSRIVLSWDPVTSHRDGTPLSEELRYQVYRSEGGADFQPLGPPITATRFTDTTPRMGRTYMYKVQVVSVYEKASVGGGETEVVSAVTVDRTPPAPPTGVRALHSGSAVKVFWEPVDERDLRGYRIYRRIAGQEGMTRVGEVKAPYVMFTDSAPPADAVRIFYAVSAIDSAAPPNESDRSLEVMIRQ